MDARMFQPLQELTKTGLVDVVDWVQKDNSQLRLMGRNNIYDGEDRINLEALGDEDRKKLYHILMTKITLGEMRIHLNRQKDEEDGLKLLDTLLTRYAGKDRRILEKRTLVREIVQFRPKENENIRETCDKID